MHRPLVSNNNVQKAKVTLVSLGSCGRVGESVPTYCAYVLLRYNVRTYKVVVFRYVLGRAGFVLNVEVDVKYLSLASFFVRH